MRWQNPSRVFLKDCALAGERLSAHSATRVLLPESTGPWRFLYSHLAILGIVLQCTKTSSPYFAMQPTQKKTLLSVIELGGYPNFTRLYEAAGYNVVSVVSVRRALSAIKQTPPDVIVAEFNFQSDFRDRTSSLESLLAAVQQRTATRIIVFYQAEQAHQLDRLRVRFPTLQALAYPIDETRLTQALAATSQ